MLFLPARKEKLWNWGLIPRWFWYKKVANLNPPPKKLKKPMQKKSSFRKKTDTYIFLMFLLGWFQVTGIPLPSKIPRSVGPQPAPVAPGAQRRTGGRPGMWPSAPGRAGASPHCQPRRRCWWCPGPWWGPQAPGWDEKWADLGGCFRDILGIFGDMVDEWCVDFLGIWLMSGVLFMVNPLMWEWSRKVCTGDVGGIEIIKMEMSTEKRRRIHPSLDPSSS